MKENALVAQDIRVEREGRVILCDVSLAVPLVNVLAEDVEEKQGAGVLVAIVGGSAEENRALFRVLAGVQRPDQGSVHWCGQEVYAKGQNLKRKMGYVPVGNLVPESLKAQRAVDYAAELRLSEHEPEARRARVLELMELLALDDVAELRVARLDAVRRFWVMVAVEMLSAPSVLMLEALPSQVGSVDGFWERLRDLCRAERVSVVCALEAGLEAKASKHLDTVYRLDGGRLSAELEA